MALLAEDGRDRASQMLALTERLCELIAGETVQIEARNPPTASATLDEKARLANAYRLELARIRQDPQLLAGAPTDLIDALKARTLALHETLAAHEIALSAVKQISEGLVQAMAEEVARLRGGPGTYEAGGALTAKAGPTPVALDRRA